MNIQNSLRERRCLFTGLRGEHHSLVKLEVLICTWYNPGTGKIEKEFTVVKKTVQRVSPPNGEDWVLMVKAD